MRNREGVREERVPREKMEEKMTASMRGKAGEKVEEVGWWGGGEHEYKSRMRGKVL